jgi:hypothetical protein
VPLNNDRAISKTPTDDVTFIETSLSLSELLKYELSPLMPGQFDRGNTTYKDGILGFGPNCKVSVVLPRHPWAYSRSSVPEVPDTRQTANDLKGLYHANGATIHHRVI